MGRLESPDSVPTKESVVIELLRVYFARVKYRPAHWLSTGHLRCDLYTIGLLDIIIRIFGVMVSPMKPKTLAYVSCVTVTYLEASEKTWSLIEKIVRPVQIEFALMMILGNNKGHRKLMIPYVISNFCEIWYISWMELSATLCYLYHAEYFEASVMLTMEIITVGVGLFVWHTVLARFLEIKDTVRPKTPGTRNNQKNPRADARTIAHGGNHKITLSRTDLINPLPVIISAKG